MSAAVNENDNWAAVAQLLATQQQQRPIEQRPDGKRPIDRRAKDALWHLAGLWARIMYVLLILYVIFAIGWVLVLGMAFLVAASGGSHYH